MPVILGIHDGTHDAGAVILENGNIIAACDEERFTRKKGDGGFPLHSIMHCLDLAGTDIHSMDAVAFAGTINPNPILRMYRDKQSAWRLDEGGFYRNNSSPLSRLQDKIQFHQLFTGHRGESLWWKSTIKRILTKELREKFQYTGPTHLFSHHHAHAASAYYQGGTEDALVVVADGIGDGLCLSVWKGSNMGLQCLFTMPYPNSYGLLYSSFTAFLGFKPFRHEGKLTGMSALGNADAIPIEFPFYGVYPQRKSTIRYPIYKWVEQFAPYKAEDICNWLQRNIEIEIRNIINCFTQQTGLRNIALAGGLFANVALNHHLAQSLDVDHVFVFPNMGDGGLAVGGACLLGNHLYNWKASSVDTLFLGVNTGVSEQALQRAIANKGLRISKGNIVAKTVDALATNKIVARCTGRMEYGPRALGNRSILANAQDIRINQRLNTQLHRSDCMPFAPMMREENYGLCVEAQDNTKNNGRYMTTNFYATKYVASICPTVVHADNTLRAQFVQKKSQPELWNILEQYEQKTGQPAIINTSFNMHERPIVSNYTHAIQDFIDAKLDALVLDEYWIEKPHKEIV